MSITICTESGFDVGRNQRVLVLNSFGEVVFGVVRDIYADAHGARVLIDRADGRTESVRMPDDDVHFEPLPELEHVVYRENCARATLEFIDAYRRWQQSEKAHNKENNQ